MQPAITVERLSTTDRCSFVVTPRPILESRHQINIFFLLLLLLVGDDVALLTSGSPVSLLQHAADTQLHPLPSNIEHTNNNEENASPPYNR